MHYVAIDTRTVFESAVRNTALPHATLALGSRGTDILTAWNAKKDLLVVLALARTHPDRRVIAHRLHRFYTRLPCRQPDTESHPVSGRSGYL